MKMALTEFLHLPTVPVKVSINEYLEISKLYSTPKSKEFINGVLDKTYDRTESIWCHHQDRKGFDRITLILPYEKMLYIP